MTDKLESREKVASAIGEHYGDLLRRKDYAERKILHDSEQKISHEPTETRLYWIGQRDATERALLSLRDNSLIAEVPSWD